MRKKFEKFISFSEFSVKRFLIPVNYMLMLKLKRSFVIIIYLFYNQFLFSKELPNDYVVPVEFSSIDKKKLDRAEELLKEGIDLWHQLNAMYNPENVRSKKIDSIYNIQAYSILVKAAKCFFEGTNAKYEVYHKNCLEFWAKHKYDSPSGLDNAKRMQKEALNYFEQARLNRRVAENYVNQYVYAYDRLYEAISLEIIATKKEGRALQVYLDWPVHYAYEWDEDVEVDLFNPKTQLVVKKKNPKLYNLRFRRNYPIQ